MPDEGLWDVKDVAKFLKRSERWVFGRLSEGSIPHVRLGTAPRFIPSKIRSWVEDGCPSTIEEPGSEEGS